MNVILEIIKFIFVLSFLVIIHELGHFLVAKFFKVKVEEFGLGYPPRAVKLFTWLGTPFTLNWFPFGGFVKLEGEDGQADQKEKIDHNPKHIGPFYDKSARVRLLIILAGASVNFIFGVLAFSLYFSFLGIPNLSDNARISSISQGSPAEKAHIPTNVDITAVITGDKRTAVSSVAEATSALSQHLGEDVIVVTTGQCDGDTCNPQEQKFSAHIRTKAETPANQGSLGIAFASLVVQKFYPWYEMPFRGAYYGTKQAFMLSYLIVTSLGQIVGNLFHGHVPQEVAGPVGIFKQASQAGFFSHGVLELINFAGLLSVNLAVMNVLPIPALDGGRALFIILEKIIGKKRVQLFEGYANYGGFALLMIMIVLITLKDIVGIFQH